MSANPVFDAIEACELRLKKLKQLDALRALREVPGDIVKISSEFRFAGETIATPPGAYREVCRAALKEHITKQIEELAAELGVKL